MSGNTISKQVSGRAGRLRGRVNPWAGSTEPQGIEALNTGVERSKSGPEQSNRDGMPIVRKSGFTQGGAFDPRGQT